MQPSSIDLPDLPHRRRSILQALTALTALGGLPSRAPAQVPARASVGFISAFGPGDPGQVSPLREGLAELGWVEGRNLSLDVQFTQGDASRARQILAGYVRQPVDVIVARATQAAHLAREATSNIPIVMLVSDPLATGLVRSLARPEANLTGLSLQGPDLSGKRLQFLKAIMPQLRTVGFLGASTDPNAASFVQQTQAAATSLGLGLKVKLLERPAGLQDADIEALARQGAGALLVQPIFTGQQERIVAAAMRQRMAVVSNYAAFVRAGGLLSYGPDDAAITRRSAWYVDRLLRGSRPGDLPVEQPSHFSLAVNRATARSLGLVIPQQLLVTADTVLG